MTKKIIQAISVLLALAGLMAGTAASAFADSSQWDTTWTSSYAYLDDDVMDNLYSTLAGETGYTADQVESGLASMLYTAFSSITILDITSILGAQKDTLAVKIDGAATVSYTYEDTVTVSWGEYSFDWYCFTAADAGDYEYIIVTAVHQDGEDGMLHFHLRYGSTSFNDLIGNEAYNYWWPTFVRSSLTAEDVAAEYAAAESVAEFAAMIPAILSSQGVNPVPVPGAIWLFGSGLIALAGIRRRGC